MHGCLSDITPYKIKSFESWGVFLLCVKEKKWEYKRKFCLLTPLYCFFFEGKGEIMSPLACMKILFLSHLSLFTYKCTLWPMMAYMESDYGVTL